MEYQPEIVPQMNHKVFPNRTVFLEQAFHHREFIFQVLEVNGQSFEHGTRYGRALEILKGVCHLSITVKSNLLAFQEMLQTPEDTPRSRSRGKSTSGRIEEFSNGSENSGPDGRSSSLSTVNSTGNSR